MISVVIAHLQLFCFVFFFFNDTATTEIYTLSLHDALPISLTSAAFDDLGAYNFEVRAIGNPQALISSLRRAIHDMNPDRKSTRLNSSHDQISYAVFCLKKKNNL